MSRRPSGTLSPSSRCRRSASHAPPVWIPTIAVSAVATARSLPTRSAQRVSASGHCMAIEPVLEDHLRRHRVRERLVLAAAPTDLPQPSLSLDRRQALVDERDRQAKAALELPREPLRPARERVRRALGAERQPDDEPRGPPLRDELRDRAEARRRAPRVDRRERMGDARPRLADRDANEALAVVEAEHGARPRSKGNGGGWEGGGTHVGLRLPSPRHTAAFPAITRARLRRRAWRTRRRAAPSRPRAAPRRAV